MKIAIRTPNWLGDVVMSTAFVQAVLKKYPSATVDLIVPSGVEMLPLPQRGTVYVFDRKKQSPGAFGWSLRNCNYDLFFVLPPSFSSAWMAFWSGAKKRIGYRGHGRGWLLNDARTLPFQPRTRHLIEEYLHLLDDHPNPQDFTPTLLVEDTWIRTHWPEKVKIDSPFVAISPGAIYGPAKRWPLENFARLAEDLKNKGMSIAVVGNKDDTALGETLREAVPGTINLCGQTTLTEFVSILARADLVVSNDSGTMHVAAALKRPQIAIFGSTSPTWTGPINPNAHVAYLKLECSPCFKRICPLGHTNCLNQLAPSVIWELSQALIAK